MSIENFDEPYCRERGDELISQSMLPIDKTLPVSRSVDHYFSDDKEITDQVYAAACAQDAFAKWLLAAKGIEDAWDIRTLEAIEEHRAMNDIAGEIRSLRGFDKSDEQLATQATEELDASIEAIAGAIAIGSMQD